MPIPEFKRTDVFQQITSSFDLARELSIELDTRGVPPTENDIYAAVYVMNQHLMSVKQNVPTVIKAGEAYLDLPDDKMDVEFLPESLIEQARVEQAIVRGRVERFHWFGSATLTAFGAQMYGVELISPYRKYHSSAFVPVESISLQLAS